MKIRIGLLVLALTAVLPAAQAQTFTSHLRPLLHSGHLQLGTQSGGPPVVSGFKAVMSLPLDPESARLLLDQLGYFERWVEKAANFPTPENRKEALSYVAQAKAIYNKVAK